jgi:hypothetical protein
MNQKILNNVIQGNITTIDREDEALLGVGAKAGGLPKRLKDARKVADIFSYGRKEYCRIIGAE